MEGRCIYKKKFPVSQSQLWQSCYLLSFLYITYHIIAISSCLEGCPVFIVFCTGGILREKKYHYASKKGVNTKEKNKFVFLLENK